MALTKDKSREAVKVTRKRIPSVVGACNNKQLVTPFSFNQTSPLIRQNQRAGSGGGRKQEPCTRDGRGLDLDSCCHHPCNSRRAMQPLQASISSNIQEVELLRSFPSLAFEDRWVTILRTEGMKGVGGEKDG